MADKAIQASNGELGDFDVQALNAYLGACALAYILEPDQAPKHAQQVFRAITEGLDRIEFDEALGHRGVVHPLNAAFQSILALDVVYDDLSEAQRAACEAIIESKLSRINREGSWPLARIGAFHTWEIYQGCRSGPDDVYYNEIMSQITSDGVSPSAPNYAAARLAMGDAKRTQKAAYMDVLEFTGHDRRYYDDARIRQFLRWFYGSAIGPDRNYLMFGDMFPNARPRNSMLAWRIGRFDDQAASYAAHLLRDQEPYGHFIPYILMEEALPEPQIPDSRFFRHGGAFFHHASTESPGMSALLYNITEHDEWHTNREVNGLGLNAFGCRMLVNGGWLGPITQPAPLQNTLTVDGVDHRLKRGGGIARGIVADGFDFALGDSGKALGQDHFERALMFIHPTPSMPGYIVVLDDVTTSNGQAIQSYLHPATEQAVREVKAREHYQATIDHHASNPENLLSFFYVTEPHQVEMQTVPSGDLERAPSSGRHERLTAEYATEDTARPMFALFPHHAANALPDFSRYQTEGAAGLMCANDDVRDFALAIENADGVTINDCDLIASIAWMRWEAGSLSRVFMHDALSFKAPNFAFQSSASVTCFSDGKTLWVDGSATEIQWTLGDGRQRVSLPGGYHRIQLATGTVEAIAHDHRDELTKR